MKLGMSANSWCRFHTQIPKRIATNTLIMGASQHLIKLNRDTEHVDGGASRNLNKNSQH